MWCQKIENNKYALFSQNGVFCQNSIYKEFDTAGCTSECSGDPTEKCGSDKSSNVYLTTGDVWVHSQDK